MNDQDLLKRYEKLKRQLLDIDFICVGSLMRVFQECGKPNCHCHQDKKYRHGPYYFWTRKVGGKTVTRKLSKEQAAQCKKWIQNHRKVNELIKNMRQLSSLVATWCH